ncbi:MAG: SPASM domain-containing protein [Planctomycetota bacterium]
MTTFELPQLSPPAPAPKVRRERPVESRRVNPGSLPTLTTTTVIDLDITDGCNLACSYCSKNLDHPNNMSLETARDAVEWLLLASGQAQQIGVNFMGGEPSLRFKMIKRLVPWAKRRAQSVGKTIGWSFTSNMTAWTDELRAWVDDNGCGVLMSIDGCPEVQDAQRPSKDGRPKSEIIAHWTRSMLRTRPLADARMTVAPKWVHKLYDSVVYLWEDIGFQNVVMADADYDNWTLERIETYREQQAKIADYLFEDFKRGGQKSVAIYAYYMKHLVDPRQHGRPTTDRPSPCGAGYNYCMIDFVGDVWPCHRFDGAAEDSGTCNCMRLGNIYDEGYNEKLSNAFRCIDHHMIAKPECKTCPVEPICGGFCPAANLQDTKDSIYTPHDGYCRLKWILYDTIEKLYNRMRDYDPEALERKIAAITIGGTGET